MIKKYVSYLRVSTNRQGESGLGLEAQRAAVVNFVGSLKGEAEIVKEFVEVESGKKADRPVLAEALRECKANGYTLLVAKLDRLTRNLHFITALQNSKVDFVAGDLLPKDGGFEGQRRFFPVLADHLAAMRGSVETTILTFFGNDDFHPLEPLLDDLAAKGLCANLNAKVHREAGLVFCGIIVTFAVDTSYNFNQNSPQG